METTSLGGNVDVGETTPATISLNSTNYYTKPIGNISCNT